MLWMAAAEQSAEEFGEWILRERRIRGGARQQDAKKERENSAEGLGSHRHASHYSARRPDWHPGYDSWFNSSGFSLDA